MIMSGVLKVIHIASALALVGLILIQTSKGGLGTAFGGGEFYRTKRGAEKIVFMATAVLAVIFLITSIISVVVS